MPPPRLRFAEPAAQAVSAELEVLGLARAVILSTPGHADEARAFAVAIGPRTTGTVARTKKHTPVDVTAAALVEILALNADCLVS